MSGSELFWDRIRHLILPVLSLGLLTASGWIRYQRASTIEVLDSDYMRLARAKGVRNRTVIRRHGLRNALIPLVTVMAIDIGALFGGAIITEKVYVWNAMGSYLNDALGNEDTYAVIGWVMVSALFVVIFNLIADLLYAALDPRIRLS
jgi:peptide/nickel transport system permease protein